MTDIVIREGEQRPIYQQIVDSFSREIRTGVLIAGYKLPTVRQLSGETGISKGTVKHAYDILEQLGLIEKTQGRGTFVCDIRQNEMAGKKDRALQAINKLLDEMEEMRFSPRDIRIFFDLKLREREEAEQRVKVGVVDCSPEALALIREQASAVSHADLHSFALDNVLERPGKVDLGMDLVVTTPTHYDQLLEKMPPDCRLFQIVLSVMPDTVLALARIQTKASVGILSASRRFGEIIFRACEQYCVLQKKPEAGRLGDLEAVKRVAENADILILPPNYLQFCSPQEQAVISGHERRNAVIPYRYLVERGSLLYLKEQIDEIQAATYGKNF